MREEVNNSIELTYGSKLPNGVSYKCDQIEEAQSIVAGIFCPHELRPQKTSRLSKFRMNHIPFGKSSSLNYLKYGSEVCVEPGEMEHVFNVQVQLSGQTKTVCGKRSMDIGSGSASILSPSEYVTMDWTEDSSMLIYSVSKTAVENKLRSLLGNHLCKPIIFDAKMDCGKDTGSAFWRALQYLQKELALSKDLMNTPLAVEHFEQSLILSLLYGQRNNYTDALKCGVCMVAPVHVKRVEEYIRVHAKEKITIEDLTAISGVSARALFAGFRNFRGISPMKYLRQYRMELVRKDLKSASPNLTVTEVAMRWGFTQLGRFSVEYKKLYGESPSETLSKNLLLFA